MKELGKLVARWDKLKGWSSMLEEISNKLNTGSMEDESITLEVGPQLLHTLRHPCAIRCSEITCSKLCQVFTCHYTKGATQGVKVWLLESKEKSEICTASNFETNHVLTAMTYVSKHRVYLTFGADLVLRLFTDFNGGFKELENIPTLATTLCLVYNKEEDEVYAGGIGFVDEWKVQGAEHAAFIVPGRKFYAELTRNDWVWDVQIVRQNNHLVLQHSNGLCVLNLKTRRVIERIPSSHDGPLKCCCYYPPNDFLITGGADGKIKLFNGSVFNLMNSFIAHHGPVTGLEAHMNDPLLFSSSHDGTVRIWRLDTLQIFTRLDVGEKIYKMGLLSIAEFYIQTKKDILVYSLNQFYQFFSPVESETKRLMNCRAKGRQNRILGSTEDGSVRLFSPVTGLTLTIIYPMASFQVLTSFSYDIHQGRLLTVLTDGSVIVFNTTTNPCKAKELWSPSREDEQVNILLQVPVEFTTDEGPSFDNLVLAGLRNGQITLCEAAVCSLHEPIQAHEGAVMCLESCLNVSDSGKLLRDTVDRIVSGGTDQYVKVWSVVVQLERKKLFVNVTLVIKILLSSVPLFQILLSSVPLLLCMYSDIVCVALFENKEFRRRWPLVMYKLVPMNRTGRSSPGYVMPLQMSHPVDEDHTQELTALDKCPMINLVVTSGKDGFVKVWSRNNELLREMNFATPIYAVCFANDRGDILVGYGTNVCSVSVVNYLPLRLLKDLLDLGSYTYKKDIRELPVTFENRRETWLDLTKLKSYSLDIYNRRRQRLEEDIIQRLKHATEKTTTHRRFVIYIDGGTTKLIRNDLADRLLSWARGVNKSKRSKKRPYDLVKIAGESVNTSPTSNQSPESTESSQKLEFFDSENLLQVYPSEVGVAIRSLESHLPKGPIEMRLLQERDLLKKEPIIAPDGYIPNSVIRKKFKLEKATPRWTEKEKPFELKPVPKVNPSHMPSWWGYDDGKGTTKDTTTPVSAWEDSTVSDQHEVEATGGRSLPPSAVSQTRSARNLSADSQSHMKGQQKLATTTPTSYKLKSRRIELNRVDLEIRTPEVKQKHRKSAKKSIEKKSQETPSLPAEENSNVQEKQSPAEFVKTDLIKQLLQESWMPKMNADSEFDDIMCQFVALLDDSSNPVVFARMCEYLMKICTVLGVPQTIMNMIVGKIGSNLDSENGAVKKNTIKTLQFIGQGRPDVMLLLLPQLISGEEHIRRAAADAIATLTGARDKEQLLITLESMGIIHGAYSSKADEEYAMSILAERFANTPEDPQRHIRISEWVQDTTPGVFDEELDVDQVMGRSRSQKSSNQGREPSFLSEGRELSFKSEGKSGKKEWAPRSKRNETGYVQTRASFRRKKFQDIDGFSTISDRSSSSRKSRRSGRFTPKDPKLYHYYDNLIANKEGQPKNKLQEDEDEDITQKDSAFHTLSNITSSQVTDRLSSYDSGITKEISDMSYQRAGHQGFGAMLSPVKSESASPRPRSHTSPQSSKDWRKFFDMVPNAAERRQMEQIRREMEAGKLKPTTLPPISYFAEDLPMLPGEAGTRLLQTVRVGEKVPHPGDGRHRIESVPGKLAVHTQNEHAGLSNYGILQMQWTTEVPSMRDRSQPPRKIPQHRPQGMMPDNNSSDVVQMPNSNRLREFSDEDLRLPHLEAATPQLTNQLSANHYEWALPLPPPPAKESRTNVAAVKKDHDAYCKYYQLVKKKLHLYTSQQRERTQHLPEVFVKQLKEGQPKLSSKRPQRSRTLTKSDLSPSHFPPIKIGQLIRI
ncbi:uncharacterized protein LOC127847193 isoform X1 [Dreissena polymorpha]|uniref:uncharacterized protein LOC127847193 isoform X1 n=1 Tax=Dreissena polymorpha TaxID=45954 RepID=UPI0022650763|nr:uncharacterized protein LOC127847193 isoform X1 [Dreissena polymorpha]